MLVCWAWFFWATTRTVQVSTVHPLGWLFTYKFFQFPWWAGRELRAKAVLARKWACISVPNSSCRSRALGSDSLMPSPWLHWAVLSSCLPQEKGSLEWPKASDTEITWLIMGQLCEQHDSSSYLCAMGIARASDLKVLVTLVWQWCSLGDPNLWNPGYSMPSKCRWIYEHQRSAQGSCSFPSPLQGVQSSRSISWCLPNMTLFHSPIPSLKMGTFFRRLKLLFLTGSVDHLSVDATSNCSENSCGRMLD